MIKQNRALAAVPDQRHGRPARPAGTLAWWAARGAAAAAVGLIVLAAVPGMTRPFRSFPEEAPHGKLVTAAYRQIHHALPSQPITLSVLADRPAQHYLLQAGLVLALTGAGYQVQATPPGTGSPAPYVTVLFHGDKTTVAITKMPASHPPAHTLRLLPPQPAAGPRIQTGGRPD